VFAFAGDALVQAVGEQRNEKLRQRVW